MDKSQTKITKKTSRNKISNTDSEEFYSDFIENSSVIIHSVKPDGSIIFTNKTWLKTLGYSKKELKNIKIFDVVHPQYLKDYKKMFKALLGGKSVELFETAFSDKDGNKIWLEGNINCKFKNAKTVSTRAVFHNITDRKKHEFLLQGEKIILEKLSTNSTISQILEALCIELEKLYDDMACMFMLMSDNRNQLYYSAGPSLSEGYINAIYQVDIGPSHGSCGTAAYRKEQVIVADIENDPLWENYRDIALSYGYRACWSTPILYNGNKVLGTFAMHFKKLRKPKTFDLDIIERIVNLARVSIKNKNDEKEIKNQNIQLEILSEISTQINSVLDIETIFRNLIISSMRLTGASAGTAGLVVDGKLVLKEYVKQGNFISIDYVFEKGYGVPGHVLESKKPYISNDVINDPFVVPEIRDELGFYNLLNVPIINNKGDVIGCFEIHNKTKGMLFEESDVKLLESLSVTAAIAIENARILEELKNTEEKLKIANTITKSLNESYELSETCKVALDNIISLDNVDLACVYIVEEYTKEAVLLDQRNFPAGYLERASRIPHNKGATWKVINTGKVLNVKDVLTTSFVGPAGVDTGFRSMLGIPIILEKDVIGVFWLLSFRVNQYSKEIEEYLFSIGNQIAISIARAKMYAINLKKKRNEEIVNAVTRSIHQSISLQSVLNNIVDSVIKYIDNADSIATYLVEGDQAVLQTHRGLPNWYSNRLKNIPRPKGFTWKTIIEGKYIYCPDVDKDTIIGPAGRELGIKSYLSMPIDSGSTTIGCINIHSVLKDAFDNDELQILNIVASQIGVAIDNAKQAEALSQSQKSYRDLVDTIDSIVWEANPDTFKFTFVSNKAEDILGYPVKVWLDDPDFWYNHLHKDDREWAYNKFLKELSNKNSYQTEYRMVASDGSIIWIRDMLTFVTKKDRVVNMRGIMIDITEWKLMEEEILKAQKLDSLGILAGGIAHDFNNHLTSILGNISLAKFQKNQPEKIYERLSEAEAATLRAKDLTQQLLTFSKGGTPIKEYVNTLSDIVRETSNFTLSGSKSRCIYDIEENLWPVKVDAGQISQVIHNIVINADQAMPVGGLIKITLNNIKYDDNVPKFKQGRYVKITIEDEGIGMNEEIRSKIFDPYFTTKQTGSGIGLATVYSIIRNHEGFIDVESELGKGSIFTINMPATEKLDQSRKPELNLYTDFKASFSGDVLIMDDDEHVRVVLGEMLKFLGFKVDYALEGNEAIDKYINAMNDGNRFDFIIMDLTIPGGMGGMDTNMKLLEIDPDMKSIVSSGFSNDPIMSDYTKHGFKGVICKPYKLADLIKVLNEISN